MAVGDEGCDFDLLSDLGVLCGAEERGQFVVLTRRGELGTQQVAVLGRVGIFCQR